MTIKRYYVIALTTSDFFIAHERYNSYDGSPETGLFVMDKDNKEHYLSPAYLLSNFEIGVETVNI